MNRKYTLTTFFVLFTATLCFQHANAIAFPDSIRSHHQRVVPNVYRVPMGVQDGKRIWIVDGLIIRRLIFNEFLYGGNNQRYPFVPENEIWIDHAIAAEEYSYTLRHELHERDLMAKKGMSYADAHDSSLALEQGLRKADKLLSDKHESELNRVSPTDCDGIKEIAGLPDSISLHGIYRQFLGDRNGVAIWIVDGAAVRREIFPDYGLSGNDLAYHFIPKNEIWIDGQIDCEETEFSVASELRERELMSKGKSYDDAYTDALNVVAAMRNKADRLSREHKPLLLPDKLVRDIGTGKEK